MAKLSNIIDHKVSFKKSSGSSTDIDLIIRKVYCSMAPLVCKTLGVMPHENQATEVLHQLQAQVNQLPWTKVLWRLFKACSMKVILQEVWDGV